MKSTLALLIVFGALATGACTVGPNYKRPLVETPDAFRGAARSSEDESFGGHKWWEVFEDTVLRDLITTAVRQNFDVRIAAARVLQAQAQFGIVRADQWPTVDAARRGARRLASRLRRWRRTSAFDVHAPAAGSSTGASSREPAPAPVSRQRVGTASRRHGW